MKGNNRGFIFFMTLCLISIMSALVLLCLQHLLLYHQVLNKQEEGHQRFYQLENIALQLINNPSLVMAPECIQWEDSANKAMEMLAAGKGCLLQVEGESYLYLLEDLGDFPCLILTERKKKLTSHHLRLSLLLEGRHGFSALGLQIRLIKSGGISKCKGRKHNVFSGISSWRPLFVGAKPNLNLK